MSFNLDWLGDWQNDFNGSFVHKRGFCWTPDYTGSGFVVIAPFSGEVSCNVLFSTGGSCVLNNGSNTYMSIGVDFKLYWAGFTNVKIDGVSVPNPYEFVIELNREYLLEATIISSTYISMFGGFTGHPFDGTLKDVRLTSSVDKRLYESVIFSDERPTTLELEDSIGDKHGTMVDFIVGDEWRRCGEETSWIDIMFWDDLAHWNNPYENQA